MKGWLAASVLPLLILAQPQLLLPSSFSECTPAQLSWTGSKGLYQVQIMSQQSVLETLPWTSDSSMTWVVDQPQGTQFAIKWTDGQGNTMCAF
jgi:hypothetical protein